MQFEFSASPARRTDIRLVFTDTRLIALLSWEYHGKDINSPTATANDHPETIQHAVM
jgi:hypothetical protein